jgi:hypothetical protein
MSRPILNDNVPGLERDYNALIQFRADCSFEDDDVVERGDRGIPASLGSDHGVRAVRMNSSNSSSGGGSSSTVSDDPPGMRLQMTSGEEACTLVFGQAREDLLPLVVGSSVAGAGDGNADTAGVLAAADDEEVELRRGGVAVDIDDRVG